MKATIFCVSILNIILFSSCTKEPALSGFELDQELISQDGVPKLCTELFKAKPARAFGHKSTFWNKHVLRVRFLGGTNYVQEKVKRYANEWSRHAHIKFEFVQSEPSDIRISFDQDDGSWSYVGRSNQYVSPAKATMNFGWFNSRTSETEFRRTTLHEFGHAIGLSHEHQHPQAAIDWDRDAVYAYYKRTQDWSRNDVDGNIFRRYSTGSSNYSTYDPLSIMHYYIPRSLVRGAWNPTSNSRLSETDIEFIGQIYPLEDGDEFGSCTCPQELKVVDCEDFESFSAATFAEAQDWTRWSLESGPAEFQTYTWGKILKLQYEAEENPDVIYHPRTLNNGVYQMEWDMYVGDQNSAYFNVQKFREPGREFGIQIYFDVDQSGRLEIADQQRSFTYAQRRWNRISMTMDFENDWLMLKINDTEIGQVPLSWQARTRYGTNQFAGINFYAIDKDSRFWLDDFCLSEGDSSMVGTEGVAHSATSLTNQRIKGK